MLTAARINSSEPGPGRLGDVPLVVELEGAGSGLWMATFSTP